MKSASDAVVMSCRASSSWSVSWYAAVRSSELRACTMIELTASRDVPPKISSAAVVIGTMAVSSGSDVVDEEVEEPTELSTPTTVRGSPSTSTVWPTGSSRLKSSEAVTEPRTTTASWSLTSWLSMNLPWATVSPRTVIHEGVEPTTEVDQLLVPAVRVSVGIGDRGHRLDIGRHGGRAQRTWRRRWSGSRRSRTRPVCPSADVLLPGETVSRLVPRAVMSELTWAWAPSPSPTVRMTAAIPMRMPRTVSPERSRWVRIPLRPVRNVSSQLIARARGRACRPR